MVFISTTFAKDNTPISAVLEECNNNRLFNLELGSNHCWENDIENIVLKYNFNYLVHNYFPVPHKKLIINIASQNKYIWEESLNHIYNSIDFCHQINAKLYTFHIGFLIDPINTNIDSKNYDFVFKDSQIFESDYNKCFTSVLKALELIVSYAQKKKVKIAIETEGSSKKEFCFFYTPEEYEKLFHYFSNEELGINLNIGHLNIASRAFGFSPAKFIDTIVDYIVAMELSHNNGIEDEHLPIRNNEWYWKIICDERFRDIHKILEFRYTPIKEVKKTLSLIDKKLNDI